ncbi:alpha/beta hydrolase [Thalassobius sp. Cn5-15]|uniref:COG3904 family protein n=1 Tax=Thalassobius sp. Cn5-15 TaxID=2917763 RepID=UPI001EF1ADF8|nr:alpha/beta hydrolase [Thalassobius sp. Cn5-15]MCG7492625.1 alpha/beta hydrolase [Thalassobius sp. Cn5-15]
MKRRFLALGAAGFAALTLSSCGYVELAYWNMGETTSFVVDGRDLQVSGTLNQNTLAAFEKVVSENPGLTRLVLLDVPGSVDDDTNLALGHRVRDLGLNTHLTATSEVHSGGSDLFLAGVRRSMERGAVIGVHTWGTATQSGTDFPKDDPVHQAYVDYTARMLGSADFYWYTLTAASIDDSHEMSEAEIEKYRLLTEPVIVK